MELILDIGNSTITSAFFKAGKVIDISTLAHDNNITEVPYKFARTIDLILGHNVKNVIIASVVPELTELFSKCITSNTGIKIHIITHDSYQDLKNKYENINELGIDRLCNVAYAIEKFKNSVIVIDIGSALTFEIIGPEGYFEGGMILPGVDLSSRALELNTSLLPKIEKKEIDFLIGKNTVECISSGIVNGLASACDSFIVKIEKELKTEMKVILTGGDASLIGAKMAKEHEIVENMVLLGAQIIYHNQT